MTNTFFYRFDDEDDICGTNGSAYVANRTNHCRLLADGIPALSNPAGGTEMIQGVTANIDMSSTTCQRGDYPQDWPIKDNLWFHSSVREVAYPFNSKIFDKIVSTGGLE